MSLKTWEDKVLREPGAPERVSEIEDELCKAKAKSTIDVLNELTAEACELGLYDC